MPAAFLGLLKCQTSVNSKEDEFLEKADFSRDEIAEGLEDAMKAVRMEIPEYLRI